MIKWLIVLILGIPRLLYSQIACLIMNHHKDKYGLEKRYKVVRNTILWINRLFRRKLFLENMEMLNEKHEKGRLFVCNHLSMFDIMGLVEISDHPITFVSKVENSKVPFLSAHMDAIDTLNIDRSNIRQSLTICKEASKRMEEGMDVIIFAEGTRSKDGNVGTFKAALPALLNYTKSDVSFICIYNSEKVLSPSFFSYSRVNVYFKLYETVSYAYYLENRKQFNEIERNKMQSQVDVFKKEAII